jgi:hypothetical protein
LGIVSAIAVISIANKACETRTNASVFFLIAALKLQPVSPKIFVFTKKALLLQ